MKKILIIFLSLIMLLGITNIAFAVTEETVKAETKAVETEIVTEEELEVPKDMCEGYEDGIYFKPNHFGDCELHEYCYICPNGCTIKEDLYIDENGNWISDKTCIVCGHGTCELVTENYVNSFNDIEEDSEAIIKAEEASCPHTWNEWEYDLIEHEDGSVTYFRFCECGAYEEMEEQAYFDAGGQYEDCDKGRHYWCDEENIRYCEECGYSEEI